MNIYDALLVIFAILNIIFAVFAFIKNYLVNIENYLQVDAVSLWKKIFFPPKY